MSDVKRFDGARAPILVVDDDDSFREAAGEVLLVAGWGVVEARDGGEALQVLRAGLRPSLILIDLEMPVMGGEAFCRVWRSDASLAPIPVVILSASRDAPRVAERCGATGYLKKPSNSATLVDLAAALTRPPGPAPAFGGAPPR